MSNVDVERNASSMPLPPIDETVHLPKSVRDAAARADAYYKAAEAPPADGEAPPVEGAPEAPPAPVEPPKPPKAPKAKKAAPEASEAPPAPVEAPPAPVEAPVAETEWEHRYRSMKGRYDASQQILGQMQEQMTMMGEELSRTQNVLMQLQGSNTTTAAPTTSLITPKDEQDYGKDLIDLTRRAALDAVQPKLTKLEEENSQLRQQVTQSSQMGVAQLLDREVPNWREINRDVRFKNWLSLRNVYSGVVRKRELDAAYQAADAPRVLAFFKGFVSDEAIATGSGDPAPSTEQPAPAPRQAAVALENLSAPGRARPAGGDTPTPADKPIFTRAQIARFYSDVRRGMYTGRDKEKAAFEQALFAAQGEGRVR